MFQDGLSYQPINRPGTAALRWFAVVWLGVALPSVTGQEPPAEAPLPRNLAPDDRVDHQVAPLPYAAIQPTIDSSCEPSFRSGNSENCNYCLELWQGYCQEPHCLHHGVSPRHHFLGCWQFCCSPFTWWRNLGIPISLPRIRDTSRSVCCSEVDRNPCHDGAANGDGGRSTSATSPADNAPTVAPEPPQPVAPPEPPAPVGVPQNEVPEPTSEQSSAGKERSLVATNEAPEPLVHIKNVSLRSEPGTLRLVQALQQAGR